MMDTGGNALYIGCTRLIARRIAQHSRKDWFPLVATIALEWHGSQAAALDAERRAILGWQPRFNGTYKTPGTWADDIAHKLLT